MLSHNHYGAWETAQSEQFMYCKACNDPYISSTHEEATVARCFWWILARLGVEVFQAFYLTFDFSPQKLAPCLKPPSRDKYRKMPYPSTQQRSQGSTSIATSTKSSNLYNKKLFRRGGCTDIKLLIFF